MSENNAIENIYNEEGNKEVDKAENINKPQPQRSHKRTNTGLFVQKIIDDGINNNGIQREPPKQIESNLDELEVLQFNPSILCFNNDSKNNGADKFNTKNSYVYNMRNRYNNSKNNELINRKKNNEEIQNNGSDKYKINYSTIVNMENPYKDNKNDDPNNETETENLECLSVEKEVFNSQLSIVSQEDEKNTNQMKISIPFSSLNDGNNDINNYKLKFNSSSIMMQDNNEYNNESNKDSCNLNEINKNDNNENNDNNNNKAKKYSLPTSTSINTINFNPYNDVPASNNETNNNIPNSSINEQSLIDNPYKYDICERSEIDNSINSKTNNNNSYSINNSDNINNSSINMKDSQMQNSNSKISQNSSNEQKCNYSTSSLNFNSPTDNTKISNGSSVPSNPDNDKNNINQIEKKETKADSNSNSNTNSNNSNLTGNQKLVKHVLDRYKKVSKTGLANLGDTSYLNSVLQSLGQISLFASYFLSPKNQESIESKLISIPLSFVTQRLFTHLYPYPESNQIEIYSPDSYLEILSYLKSPFGKKRSNPNDLLIFILNTLHYELNSKKNNDNIIRMPYNYYFSKDNVIQNGIVNFTNNNSSRISDVITWFQLNEVKCANCGISTFSFHNFNTYDLDIKNAYQYYLRNGKNYINIYDCLSYGSIPKQYKSYCRGCKSRAINYKQSKIYSSPNVFIFLLDRGIDFNQNYNNIHFIVDEKIDLSNFIMKQDTPMKYRLTGIVSFNLKEEKYVSYCESPIDSNWYWYNDEKVNLVFCKDILSNNNDNDIPCILYYTPI